MLFFFGNKECAVNFVPHIQVVSVTRAGRGRVATLGTSTSDNGSEQLSNNIEC